MGIGALLCRETMRLAASPGGASMRLTVRHDNAAAITLYIRLGFTLLPSDGLLAPELQRLEDLGSAPYVAMEARLDTADR
ncbi:MAG: GNAT family N-acetyltransferase [Armatimonadetes bacterium]|nr:GNAT family N-acetyltransferase [Armatimonadota bacterium]